MERTSRGSTSLAAPHPGLEQSEGQHLCTAGEALLKGVLECELPIALLATPNEPAFADFVEQSKQSAVRRLLAEHACEVVVTDHAARAVVRADRASRSGRCAVALVPNDQLDRAMPELTELRQQTWTRGGATCLVLEDHPRRMAASCPRQAAARLGLATLEPTDLRQYKDMLAVAMRLSRGAEQPAAIVVHESILRSMMTVEMRPNRVSDYVPILRADRRRQRRLRFSESKDVLRLARRLELSSARALPNPGERVPIGFVTVGPADEALRHLTHVLKLHGRVPTMQLGLLHPLDETAAGRLLVRCDKVVVLEPRPGSMEMQLLHAAERLRRAGETPGSVWGREMPPDSDGYQPVMDSDDDLHPSILVRKIVHLLHEIRPTLLVRQALQPDAPTIDAGSNDRVESSEPAGAMTVLRRHLEDVDRWIGAHDEAADAAPVSSALAIDGLMPGGDVDRIVMAELWERHSFLDSGIGALAQAASSSEPWLFVVCDFPVHGGQDVERLAKSAVPARHADRVRVRSVDIKSPVELREAMREAATRDDMTVLLVRDAAPSRFDDEAILRELREVDRLGFEPVQRVRWSAEQACAIRPAPLKLPAGESTSAERAPAGEVRVDALPERLGRQFRIRVRPLDEIVEVTRTRAPVPFWRGEQEVAVPAGRPVHATKSQWRAHAAGYRGAPPGIAVRTLCEAGRRMGYDVQCLYSGAPRGPGRGAWSQVLFSRRDTDGPDSSQSAACPYGEADLLLGLDGTEVVRALDGRRSLRVGSPDVTYLVANTGTFAGTTDDVDRDTIERALRHAQGLTVRREGVFMQDVAGACRAGFYSDRVTDMVLLGVAFQRGLIPVSYAAMVDALESADVAGIGRAAETFSFGRRLAGDPNMLARPRAERVESVDVMRRRMRLSLAHSRWRGGKLAGHFDRLLESCLRGMPGLTETDAGRQARRDLTGALYRCLLWGGASYAERFADLIVQLYHVDRGDTGRALTRHAVLPLAEAMLIRDPLYVAAMATCGEHRRRIRQQLNVKAARGDQLQRRYLVRLELSLLHRRYRADVRASDWIAKVLSAARPFVPKALRGSRRDRKVREAILSVVNQARFDPPQRYERNHALLQALHELAECERLRTMPYSELGALLKQHDVTLSMPSEQADVDEESEDVDEAKTSRVASSPGGARG